MNAYLKKEKDFTLLTIEGKFDYLACDDFNKVVSGLEGENVVIDLSNLAYISSSGLRCLLNISKVNNVLKVLNPNDMVYEVLEMTGFTDFLNVER